MPRGGKRPGAGAPKRNINALKHGRYSQQFAVIGGLLASDAVIRQTLLEIAARTEKQNKSALEMSAVLLTRMAKDIRAQARRSHPSEPGPTNLRSLLPPRTYDSESIEAAALKAISPKTKKRRSDKLINQTQTPGPENNHPADTK